MKKWSKLVLATMLSVGTLLVSGCIENIEPEGIADLRGAKAELLRAQVALQAAQAAKVEAEAALVLAQAKVQEAIAKQEEAKAKYEEALALKAQYEAEAQNITNESARADLEKKIADNEAAIEQAKLDAELYALQLQEDILAAEEAAIKAQQKVDEAMRDLAVAKATLTSAEEGAITALEAAVTTARNTVESKTTALHNATIALAKAMAEIGESGKSTMVAALEQAVVVAQAELDAALEAEAEAKALLEVDKTIVDWDAKIKEYQAKLDSMDRAYMKYGEEKAALGAEISYALDQIDDKIELYENTTGYKLDFDYTSDNPLEWGTGLFKTIQDPSIISEYIDVPDVQIMNDVIDDFEIINEKYVYGEEDEFIADWFDAEIADYYYDLNYGKYYEDSQLVADAEYIAKMEKDPSHVAAMERHADAATAVKSGKYLDYLNKYVYTEEHGYDPDFEIEKAIADYNDALAAFEKGLADYEAEAVRLTVDQAAYEEIDAAETAEENAALAEQAKGYQDIESKYRAAKSVYEKAMSVNDAALYKRDREIEKQIGVARTAADDPGLLEADIEAFEAAYMDATATDEEKILHAVYVKVLEAIKAARDAYDNPDATVKTDPATLWANAQTAWTEAQAKYAPMTGTAYNEVDAAYSDKMEDIAVKYDAIWAEFYAKYPNFSTEYKDYWVALLGDLRDDLEDAAWKLETPVFDGLLEYRDDYSDIDYSVQLYDYFGNPNGELSLSVEDVAWFLTDGKNMVPVTFDGLFDKEKFVADELIDAAGDLWYKMDIEVVFNYDYSSPKQYTLWADENSEYPYAHLTYEKFLKFLEAVIGPKFDQITDVDWTGGTSSLIDLYLEKFNYEIELAASNEYYAAIPDHVKAIEAAKAEFVAYVAEKEAEFEAMKAEIEEVTTAFLAAVLPVYEEMLEEQAKYEILDFTYSQLKTILEDYISTFENGASAADLEAFELALQTAYNGAVSARISAEEALAEAEWAVDEAKAGNLNAVEIAQVKFDRATEELAEAMAKLDKATADLQALLAVIYGEE